MILRHRSSVHRGLAAVVFLALPGAATVVRPSAAAAQALGTMQVTALVSRAPTAWPTLAASVELAAGAGAGGPGWVEVGLARLEVEPGARDARRVRIRVDYLRN